MVAAKCPSELLFHTWWFESCESADLTFRSDGECYGGGTRPRHAVLRMHLRSSSFDIKFKGANALEAPVHMHNAQVTTLSGMPVQPWDLHVGTQLRVLGSTLMLRQCSATTGAWLAEVSKRLLTLKEDAIEELRKYSSAALTPALFRTRGEGAGRLAHSYAAALEHQRQGGMHLQAAADQITRLTELLAEYRPKVAGGLRARLRTLRHESCQQLAASHTAASPQALMRIKSDKLRDRPTAASMVSASRRIGRSQSTIKTLDAAAYPAFAAASRQPLRAQSLARAAL